MVSPLLYAVAFAVLMAGLLVEAVIFRLRYDDRSFTDQLSSVRDKLIGLVVAGEIDRDEPHLVAIYRNVSILLSGCGRPCGYHEWRGVEAEGSRSADNREEYVRLSQLPRSELPPPLVPVVDELRVALEHIVARLDLNALMNGRAREQSRLHKARATALLNIVAYPAW